MEIFPLVAIAAADGRRLLIEERDYDPRSHTLWESVASPETADVKVVNLNDRTISQLRAIASGLKIKGYSKLSRDDLITAILVNGEGTYVI